MEALWITLVCTVPIIIVAFVISFERIAKHERDLRYYTNSLENQIERLTTDAKEKEAKFVKGELYMKTKRKGGK